MLHGGTDDQGLFLCGVCWRDDRTGEWRPRRRPAAVCLSTRDIKDTAPQKDGTAILFTMKDGSVWRNDLKGRCPT